MRRRDFITLLGGGAVVDGLNVCHVAESIRLGVFVGRK
jgi:hypothetical protein